MTQVDLVRCGATHTFNTWMPLMKTWKSQANNCDLFYRGIISYLETPGTFPTQEFQVSNVRESRVDWHEEIFRIQALLRDPGNFNRETIRLEALDSLYTLINRTFVQK